MLGENPETVTNSDHKKRWILSKQSKVLELCVMMHSYLSYVPQLLLPGVQLEIKFTAPKSDFHLFGNQVTGRPFSNF
jgi:hypothetical protein